MNCFHLNFYSTKMFKFKKENDQGRTQEFVNGGGGAQHLLSPKTPWKPYISLIRGWDERP